MILLSLKEAFTKAQNKSHVKYFFDVPDGFTLLEIKFKYLPKQGYDKQEMLGEILKAFKKYAPYAKNAEQEAEKCLPLTNHVGFSIDSPDGWLGTKHNHCNDNKFIIGLNSSSGFACTKITAGKWSVTLSFNSIVTEKLECFIEVKAVL